MIGYDVMSCSTYPLDTQTWVDSLNNNKNKKHNKVLPHPNAADISVEVGICPHCDGSISKELSADMCWFCGGIVSWELNEEGESE